MAEKTIDLNLTREQAVLVEKALLRLFHEGCLPALEETAAKEIRVVLSNALGP